MHKIENKILSEAVRMIARQTIVTAQAMGINSDIEHAALMKAADRIDELDKAISETLEDNLDLADGENCTLIKLKKAMGL